MPIAQSTWTARVWAEFKAGNLTRAFRDVLLTLRTFRGHGGQCWPSHETLADRAECCVRTVQRALKQAQHLGLVDWVERRVRAGWRWLRTSNLYRFVVPTAPVRPGPAGGCGGPRPAGDAAAGDGGEVRGVGAACGSCRAGCSVHAGGQAYGMLIYFYDHPT